MVMKRTKRDRYMKVNLTSAEKKQFFDLAAQRNTDLSELVRQLLHRELTAQQSKEAA